MLLRADRPVRFTGRGGEGDGTLNIASEITYGGNRTLGTVSKTASGVTFTADTYDTLDKKQDAYKAEVERTANKREVFETARRMDEEMRDSIAEVFGFDICSALFGGMNVYALADGLPVWANLMLAIMDEVDTTFAREQKATNPRIGKYTKKYHK